MNIVVIPFAKFQSHPDVTSFSINVLSWLFRDPIQEPTLCLAVIPPCSLTGSNCSLVFPCLFMTLSWPKISCVSECSLLQTCLVFSCDLIELLLCEAIWKLPDSEIRKEFLGKGRGEGGHSLGSVEIYV